MTLTLTEPARETPLFGEFDVLVLGGGPAGIAAASAAAQGGASTLLVEHYGFLGGMGTAAGVTNFCGLHANVHGKIEQVVHGVANDLLARMRALGGLNEPHILFGGKTAAQAYDNAAFKIAADELVIGSGAKLLFHAHCVGVVMRSVSEIDAILIETKSGRMAIRARTFIDCSGDGDLSMHAGGRYEKGSSGSDMLYPSHMFRINGVDPVRAGDAWNHFGRWMEEETAKTGRTFPRKTPIIRPQKNPTEWRANVTQLANPDGSPVDGTDAVQLSWAEVEGRKQIVDFFQFLRASAPGFENAYILEIAPQLGIRETRRVVGGYQLTEQDVLDCANFDDSIGVNAWPIEAHVAGDVVFKFQQPGSRGFNHLPWRMLLPKGIDNLLVAGRCASMTHMGQSAARVSGGCFVMGEAAGTGAAMALANNLLPRKIEALQLQKRLVERDAYLGLDR